MSCRITLWEAGDSFPSTAHAGLMTGVLPAFGISLPGDLAPYTDALCAFLLFQGLLVWYIMQERGTFDRLKDGTLRLELQLVQSGGQLELAEPEGDVVDVEEEEPVLIEAPPQEAFSELPEDAGCIVCSERLVDADIWAQCIDCNAYHHTVCLGRIGKCGACGQSLPTEEDEKDS